MDVKKDTLKLLYGDSCKYWDADIGWNMVFCRKNSFLNFVYDSIYQKHFVSYGGDLLIDTIKFSIKYDTIFSTVFINAEPEFVILQLTEDTLMLKDLTRGWAVDTLLFLKSKDQKNRLIYPAM